MAYSCEYIMYHKCVGRSGSYNLHSMYRNNKIGKYDDDMTIGIEIECRIPRKTGRENVFNLQRSDKFKKAFPKWVVLKHDGSVAVHPYSLEVVTLPITYNRFKSRWCQLVISTMLDRIKSLGYHTNDRKKGRCSGIHIHVNGRYLDTVNKCNDLCNIVSQNALFFEIFSNRKTFYEDFRERKDALLAHISNDYSNNEDDTEDEVLEKYYEKDNRIGCIGFTDKGTAEIRMFKSILDIKWLNICVDLSCALTRLVNRIDKPELSDLFDYCKTNGMRDLYSYLVKVNKKLLKLRRKLPNVYNLSCSS